MKLKNKTVLVTGSNRGIGRALVEALKKRGVKKVYAAARKGGDLALDVTDPRQIEDAAAKVPRLDLLINNAGVAVPGEIEETLPQHIAVNFHGPRLMTEAFLPQLKAAKGAVANVLSVVAFAPVPGFASYSISKAAAHSLTQSHRQTLGLQVHGIYPGPVDTDMARSFPIDKATPESVAEAILDGIEADEDEIFPDPVAATMAEGIRNGPGKALEKQFASLAAAA